VHPWQVNASSGEANPRQTERGTKLLKVRSIWFLGALVAGVVAFSVASADTQYMEVTGCVGSGSSTVYGDTSALGLSDGCSGADTLIVSTAYTSGGGAIPVPAELDLGSGDSYCVF
jgi:hypothetical protein